MTFRSLVYILFTFILLVALGLVIGSVEDESLTKYSSFPIGLAKAVMGILLWKIIDDTVFGKITTIDEIKKGNISYAIICLASAIIIAACIGSA